MPKNKYILFLILYITIAINILFSNSCKFAKIKSRFLKGPYLIYENINTQMLILWQATSVATTSEIEWGTSLSYGKGPFKAISYGDNQYKFNITGLQPETFYYYRINLDGTYRLGNFKTAPLKSSSSVTFYAYGDTRKQTDKHNIVLRSLIRDINKIPSERQTFLLHTGDCVSNGDKEDDWNKEFFNPIYPNLLKIQSKLPIMIVKGNHEKTGYLLKKYFPFKYQNQNAFYYSFDYGPVHVSIVDDNAPREPYTEQHNWIISGISKSNKKWQIIAFHQPAWGAGTHENNKINQMLTSEISKLKKTIIVLNGHDHLYAHCYKKPIHYITTGGGGAPLYDLNPKAPYFTKSIKSYHFVRIDIDGNVLCLNAIGTNNNIFDHFCIENEY